MEFDENLNPMPEKPKQPEPAQTPQSNWAPPIRPNPTQKRVSPSPTTIIGIIAGVVIILGGIIVANRFNAPTPPATINGQSEGLNVSSEGVVYATPDIAKLRFGVQQIGPDAGRVEEQISDSIANIKDALGDQDIDDKDIKTVSFGVYPDYGAYPLNENSRIRSYTGSHILEVTIRDLDTVNDIASAVIKAGANQVENVYFTVEDPEEWYQEARSQAVSKAKAKAEQLAKEADIRLGKLISINENTSGGPIYYDRAISSPGGFGGGGEFDTGIESGSLEIRAYVTLIYQIR